MITRLKLVNYRRHRDTTLTFGPHDQLTLISGANGVGKSTIFQALLWALVADSGKVRRSEQLIRRGCDIEGMSVEADLLIDGSTWTVRRHRDARGSGATLHCDDTLVVSGAAAVTDAVTSLLGTDAVGLRLAVYAAQGELDALASLRPAERATAIARLLRVDDFTRARDAARTQARTIRDTLEQIPSSANVAGLHERIDALTELLQSQTLARAAAQAEVLSLSTQLSDTGDLDRKWAEASREAAHAEGLAQAAHDRLERARTDLACAHDQEASLRAELASLRDVDVSDVAERQRVLEQDIARAEQSQSILAHRDTCRRELESSQERLAVLERLLAEGDDTVLAADLLLLDASVAAEEAAVESSRRTMLALPGLPEVPDADTCPECGQDIDESHRAAIAARVADLQDQRRVVQQRIDDHLDALRTQRSARADLAARLDQVRAAASERADLRRRCQVWTDQLARTEDLLVDDVDLLYAERARLAVEASHAQRKTDLLGTAQRLSEQIAALQQVLHTAIVDLEDAHERVTLCAISDALAQAWETREKLRSQLDAERDLLTELEVSCARTQAELDGARELHAQATQARAQRAELTELAQSHADAAASLDKAATLLTSRIRPALSGEVSQLLSQLSDGRFTQVRLDEAYALEVFDDGDWRDIGDCSGGERDLIALAMRLGLAESLSGTSGLGWVLLDEVFGSQDPARRDQILIVLRALRSRFSQILAISHVGGLDDTADRVIALSLTDADDGLPAVTVRG